MVFFFVNGNETKFAYAHETYEAKGPIYIQTLSRGLVSYIAQEPRAKVRASRVALAGEILNMSNSHRPSTIPSLASIPQTDARRIVDPSPSSSPRYRPSFIIFSIYSFLRPPSRPRETFLPPCPVRAQSHGMWVMCISVCPAITRKNGSSRREGPRASGPGPPRRTISPSWSTPAPERYAHQSHRSIIYLVSTKENHS